MIEPALNPLRRPSLPAGLIAVFAVSLSCLSWAAVAHAAILDADTIDGIEIGSPLAAPVLRSSAPDVGMASGLLVAADGRELWARFPDDRRAMASTTKIMSAIVVMEKASLDDRVTVSPAAARVGEAAAGLASGKTYTVRKLLEAMLVKSGNDAAVALAEHVGGSVEGFVAMMNAKAAELDLRSTTFRNPHGLDQEGHLSSAEDLAVLSRHALGLPGFSEIVLLPKTTVPGRRGTVFTLENSNKLVGNYPGVTGVKTGWTNGAGYCVVASAEREGVGLVAVVLGAQSESTRFSYARRLLDWGFEHYVPTRIAQAGEDRGAVPVADYLDVTVPVTPGETLVVPVLDLAGPVAIDVRLNSSVRAPVSKGQRLGIITVTQQSRLLAQIPLVAASGVEAPGAWQRIAIAMTRLWRSVFGGPLMASPVGATIP